MAQDTFLSWMIQNTKTQWWHDSAAPKEVALGMERGAVGITTNPFLTNMALAANDGLWTKEIAEVLAQNLKGEAKAEALMKVAILKTSEKMMPLFQKTGGELGFVCAQVNPMRSADRATMMAMVKRYTTWAPNITVKLPATLAGLDVMEDCIAQGISITMTVSFSVPQVLAIGERTRKGEERAKAAGVKPGKCFSVVMIGRLDDYLRDIALDNKAEATEADIRLAGLACTKRAVALYKERKYTPKMIIAALRGTYHTTELAGADLIMSIAPDSQTPLVTENLPRKEGIANPVPADAIKRLSKMKEFVKAYEPDGMKPEEFATFGPTNRTLIQFVEVGWKLLEKFQLPK